MQNYIKITGLVIHGHPFMLNPCTMYKICPSIHCEVFGFLPSTDDAAANDDNDDADAGFMTKVLMDLVLAS